MKKYMYKKWGVLLTLVCLAVCITCFASCTNTDDTTPKEHSITFTADDIVVAALTYTEGDRTIDAPTVPEKAGYVGVWEKYTLSGENLVVKAVYTPITYIATFSGANGTVLGTQEFTVNTKTLQEPTVPVRAGYVGVWEDYVLSTGDITINAVYTPITYNVTFRAGDSILGVHPYTIEDTAIALPAVPDKTGYIGAWEDYVLSTGDITVNAVYTPIAYTVTFMAEDAVVEVCTYTVEDTNLEEPTVPKKTGYRGVWEEYTLSLGDIIVNAKYYENEIILCDQKNGRFVVYDVDDMPTPIWEWTADAWDMGNVSGVKRRHHPVWGDVVLVVSSYGYTGIVSYPSGEVLFRTRGDGNLHSIELLPDGRVMTVASDGNTVRVYTDPDTYTEFYADFPHGVLYDPARDWVWVLARHSLVAYNVNDFSSPVQTFVFPADMVEGHDLAPVYGDTNRLYLTVLSGAFIYDKTTNTVSRFSPCEREHVKGIGNLPGTDTVFCISPNGYYQDWCSNTIYRYDENGETAISLSGNTAAYKLRIFCDKYQ